MKPVIRLSQCMIVKDEEKKYQAGSELGKRNCLRADRGRHGIYR